jgi:hypothetical protein
MAKIENEKHDLISFKIKAAICRESAVEQIERASSKTD